MVMYLLACEPDLLQYSKKQTLDQTHYGRRRRRHHHIKCSRND